MKRTAATLMLLAGLGSGGCMTPTMQANKAANAQQTTHAGGYGTVTRGKQVAGVQGPTGEPIMAVRGSVPGMRPSGVVQAGGPTMVVGPGGVIRPVSGLSPEYVTSREGCTNCAVPGVGGQMMNNPGVSYASGIGYGATGPYGPQMPNMPTYGVLPVPGQGVPGSVAAVGAIGPGMMGRQGVINARSSINFTGPAGMKVTWQLPDGSFADETGGLIAPAAYNFLQGQIYRLRLGSILPDHPGKYFYPTLEVAPASPKTLTFLSHSSVPLTFSADDFAQARSGNLVVKVVYLPDPANQDFSTIIGAEEVVSTRLEPGADPVAEAQRRGTVLAVIRMGNIDLENKISPSMTAPPPGVMMPTPPRQVLPPKVKSDGGAFAPDTLPPILPTNPPGNASIKSPSAPTTLPPFPGDAPRAPVSPKAPTKAPTAAPSSKTK